MTARTFHQKREDRIVRLQKRAQAAEAESQSQYQAGHQMAQAIPFGQPILVGHHSEKRDRRYRERIGIHFRKSFEAQQKAAYYRARAEAAAKNTAIFSDDPSAEEQLEAKIARLEQRQELMKKANALIRKGDREGLLDLGFSETQVQKLFLPDFVGRIGFPSYALTNNNANIRRCKERLKELQRKAQDETREFAYPEKGVRIVDNVEDNRVQVFFPGKPAEEIRKGLRAHGFVWAPSIAAWQRHRSSDALYWAKHIVETL